MPSPILTGFALALSPGPLYLGIDAGTQSTKAVVYDATSRTVVGRGAVSYGLLPTDVIGRAEQDPAEWVDAMFEACRQALDASDGARDRVRAISVSGQQHGLVALDEAYEVIRPAKLWCDLESAAEAAEISRGLEVPIVASFTASKLLWLKRHEPQSWARLAHVALPHDYLNYVLTGNLVMEGSDASGTGFLDLDASAPRASWDAAVAALVDDAMLSKLPPLISPAEWAGTLQPSAAKRLGMDAASPTAAGGGGGGGGGSGGGGGGRVVRVAAGGGDNAMAALGSGCATVGRVAVSLGTSGTVFGRSAAAARDKSGVVCPFLDATGGGLPLVCTVNCAQPPEEIVAASGLSRAAVAALAQAEPAGCEGVTFLPYLAGERTPNWPHASGVLAGLRMGHLGRPGLLYRAALEGATFSLRGGYDAMRAAVDGMPDVRHGRDGLGEIRLVGGGARSPLWRQIVADAFGATVACPAEPESAALGAALQAAAVDAGAGDDGIGEWIAEHHDPPVAEVVQPSPEGTAALDEAFALYTERANAMFAGGG